MSVERRGTKALELWAKRATDGYPGVNISNMTTAWRSGLAFCALIHHFRPDLIEYSSLKAENILENNALAFRIAEQQLGIPALLDAEDMVECDIPDRLSVLTYVSQFYQVFASLGLTSPKRVVNKTSPPSPPAGGVNKAKLTPPPPQPKTKTEIKTDKVLVGGRFRREVCAGCKNPVFLAERLLVGSPGQLMHRTCFRCARCNTQLTLASYYETEKGQFCCETCPDEELTISAEDANSIISNTSPRLSRRTSTSDTDSEYESDGSDNKSETSEDKTQHGDRLPQTPKVSPGPPKPRTVFLSKTLEGESTESISSEHKETSLDSGKKFSQLSPALFGTREKDPRATKVFDSVVDHCDDAKGLITDPPDQLNLDTGQGNIRDNDSISDIGSCSSIVSERLKMFKEISDNTNSTSKLNNNKVVNKLDSTENNLSLQNAEKPSDLQLNISEKNAHTIKEDNKQTTENADFSEGAGTDPDKDENTKDISLEKNTQKTYNDFLEKDDTENFRKHSDKTTPIPSIKLSSEKQGAKELQKETVNTLEDSAQNVSEELRASKESGSEYNPFEDDDDDESHLEESSVAVNQSQGGSDGDHGAASASQDSGVKVSSASLSSVQYPEDLNPFGSDDDEDEVQSSGNNTESVNTVRSDLQAKNEEKLAKKLIKVNLNPFESDEDDEIVEEEKRKVKIEATNLNPFWSDDEEPTDSSQSTPSKSKPKPPRPPPPTLARNSTPSQMYGKRETSLSPHRNATEKKKLIAPSPPPPVRELFPSPSPRPPPSPSSPSGSIALRRKARRAPAPPQVFTPRSDGASSSESVADSKSMESVTSSLHGTPDHGPRGQTEDEGQDEVLNWKMQKDMKNHTNKMNGTTEQRVPPPKPARAPQAALNLASSAGLVRRPSMSKSEAGEWQRKKGPAPPRPVPQKRAIRKMPMRLVQQELQDIEIKQTELERQGVLLETAIRNRTESTSNNPQEDAASLSSGPSSIEVEDMIMQLFELVNEKNELFRRQTELMYLKREKRLEEEYVELEYQIRCLMLKPPSDKTESDTAQEEDLIARLVKVVEQRDEIINCLELDRLREAQEDESIATHMMQYQEKHIDGIQNGSTVQSSSPKKRKTLKLPRKKKKKEKKDKKGAKADADKDIDETEVKEEKKKKKKWLF